MPGPYKYLINVSHHHISLTDLFSFPVFLPSVPGPINHLRNPQACLISLPHLLSPSSLTSWRFLQSMSLSLGVPHSHCVHPATGMVWCQWWWHHKMMMITFSRFPAPILDSCSPNPHGSGSDLSNMWISQALSSSLLRKKDPVLSHNLLPLLSLRSPPPTNELQPLCLISLFSLQ